MPNPNATPAPLTMTPGVAYGDRAAAEAAFSHASAGDLRAALVRWIKEADYWRNEAGGKAVAIALNHELLSEQRAKLAEAEARYAARGEYLAAAVRDKQAAESRVAALTEAGSAMLDALEDADANLTKPDFEKCTDLHVVRMFGEPDDYDCGGVNCAQCIEQESWDKVAAAIKLGRAALSPSQDAKDGGA